MIEEKTGPIVYIDDDEDDQLLFERALSELGIANPLRFFLSGQAALIYLETTTEKPLLILCDINMPLMNGFELRQHIDASDRLTQKVIPFLFYTSGASPDQIELAYTSRIQGFHAKAAEYWAFKGQISLMVAYWQSCLHPNSF